MWQTYALLSAFFAALTAIFAKVGVSGVNSNLATAIRTVVILFIAWGIVFATVPLREIREISRHTLLFFGAFGNGNGHFLALLFQGAANRGGFKGCSA